MKVRTLLWARATFRPTYLSSMTLSACWRRVVYFRSISPWPAVATSWWWASMWMPRSISLRIHSERMSCCVSVGGTGK